MNTYLFGFQDRGVAQVQGNTLQEAMEQVLDSMGIRLLKAVVIPPVLAIGNARIAWQRLNEKVVPFAGPVAPASNAHHYTIDNDTR